MKRLLVILSLIPACAFASDHTWFTIVGDSLRQDVDTIQVDVNPVAIKNNMRLLNVRLSRAKGRVSGDGISFRSFDSLTEFDCDKKTARYTRTRFYAEPLWKAPTRVMDYPSNDVRPMAFREIEPNPNERIIRAACNFESVMQGSAASASAPRR
ncbi:MAG: hypothetical protein EOO28_15000 [Comamonadaceae bacterium]|nr:MAG: hypothetical protein EOO28_15000 [Comamonadaceae bacterium]